MPEAHSSPLDLLIIGAGPIGLACGIEAGRRGLDALILEKGCLVNSIYHFPANMTFFSTSEKIELGGLPFVSHGPRPTRREALEYYRRVAQQHRLRIRTYEKAEQVLREADGSFRIRSEKATYRARFVLIATGFYDHPQPLGVPGEELPKVLHYFDDPHRYAHTRVAVVGAANSAVDAALETWRKGAEVTMIVRGGEISPRVKYWVRPDIENRIREGSIRAFFHSRVRAISPESIEVETPEGPLSLENDFVLAMTGFRPDYQWLESAGLQFSDDAWRMPLRDEASFESNVPGIFLAGTICGGMHTSKWFIENSIEHAAAVMEEIRRRI